MSDKNETESVMDVIRNWRATMELDTLAMIGFINQRMSLIENRMHSLSQRLSKALLGEPTELDTKEMLALVDECLILVSQSPKHVALSGVYEEPEDG